MLSQRIGLDALKIKQYLLTSETSLASDSKKSLLKHSEEMRSANKKLSSGNLPDSHVVNLSKEIRELYFGEKNLSQRVNDYTSLGIRLSQLSEYNKIDKLAGNIIKLSPDLLNDLNDAVFIYQKEGEQNIDLVVRIAWIAISFLILLLILESRIIFSPILKLIENNSEEEIKRIESLSEQIELRTIKLEKANIRLRELATIDQLTGLKNRYTLLDEISLLTDNYKKNGADFGLAYIDIDFFKAINDLHGHKFGDFILKEFAKIFSNGLRDYDEFYRVGGEEFIAIFKRGSLDGIAGKIELLRTNIENHIFSDGNIKHRLTFSSGLFHSSLFNTFDADKAMQLADQALYASKNNGRNKLTIAR